MLSGSLYEGQGKKGIEGLSPAEFWSNSLSADE
jgi:hypothetical protein